MTRYLNLITGDLYAVGDPKWSEEYNDDVVKLLVDLEGDTFATLWKEDYWKVTGYFNPFRAMERRMMWGENLPTSYPLETRTRLNPTAKAFLTPEQLIKRKEFMDVEAVFKKLTEEPLKTDDVGYNPVRGSTVSYKFNPKNLGKCTLPKP